MQIEQVLAGYCGDTAKQAIQLRMRSGGQNLVNGSRLLARDAAGANPVVLLTLPGNVANAAAGSRILATSGIYSVVHGGSDFTLAQPIPDGYLAAGRLTFEASPTIYWSLAWGGASYTGSHLGAFDNDADGNFGPAFGSPLPFDAATTVRFPGAASAPSTSNSADYAVSADPATLTNNAGLDTVLGTCAFFDGFETGDDSAWAFSAP
jgi:hypothetical protein